MIDEQSDTEFEALLRSTLTEMIPKAEAASRARLQIHVGEWADVEPSTEVTAGSATDSPRSRRSRRVVGFAAALLAVATVAGVSLVSRRDSGPPTPAADSVPSASTDAATTVAPLSPVEPNWYTMIKPFLPNGFDHVAITAASPNLIYFVAIRRATNQSLEILLQLPTSERPGATGADEWRETATGYTLIAGDGRTVAVNCGIGNVDNPVGDDNDYCGPGFDNSGVTKADRKAMVESLLATFPFDQLGSITPPPRGDLETARSLMASGLPDQIWLGHGGLLQGDTVQFRYPQPRLGGTIATIVYGVYPAEDTSAEWMGDVGRRMYGYNTSSVGWIIHDGIGIRLFNGNPASDPSDRASNTDSAAYDDLLFNIASAVTTTPIPAIGSTRIDPNAATTTLPMAAATTLPASCDTYTLKAGDYAFGVAARYDLTYEQLKQANPDIETNFLPGAVLNIPCGAASVQRSNDPTGLDKYASAGSSAILGFTATNSITVASDTRVYVLTGGAIDGVGATTLDVYDRITGEQLSSGSARVDQCSGPVEIVDDPTSPLDAQPIQCTADQAVLTVDLFTGAASP